MAKEKEVFINKLKHNLVVGNKTFKAGEEIPKEKFLGENLEFAMNAVRLGELELKKIKVQMEKVQASQVTVSDIPIKLEEDNVKQIREDVYVYEAPPSNEEVELKEKQVERESTEGGLKPENRRKKNKS